jgi:signal peptidase I
MNPKRIAGYLWREWVRPLALPLLVVTAAKSAIADINYVPTGSMKPTILEGDVVFVNKLAYDLRVPFTFARLAHWAEPKRGDIVVCFSPDDGTRLVKRVIGQPGDTIAMAEDVLFVNGTPQTYAPLSPSHKGVAALDSAERNAAVFAREQLGGRSHAMMMIPARPALRSFAPVRIPAGSYFVMGDNRDNSHDSRFFGFVPREKIIGEANGVFVSADLGHGLRPRLDRFFSKLE